MSAYRGYLRAFMKSLKVGRASQIQKIIKMMKNGF